MFSHQRKQYLGVFYSLKARAIANFGVFERVRAFVGVWTTAFLSVVFYTFKTEYRRQSPLEVRYWRCIWYIPDLRVLPQGTNQDDFVYTALCHLSYLIK